MHQSTCYCPACCRRGAGEFEVMGFITRQDENRTFSEEQELELALELLEISSEEELDQFLGKMLKGAWKGIKKVGSAVGKIAKPFAGVLKSIAKKALPFVGGALGSFIPIPGVGTALGSAVGGALSKALEMEFEGAGADERELEMAKRFVRFSADAARLAANGSGTEEEVRQALMQSLQWNAPGYAQEQMLGQSGRWNRSGNSIVLGRG